MFYDLRYCGMYSKMHCNVIMAELMCFGNASNEIVLQSRIRVNQILDDDETPLSRQLYSLTHTRDYDFV